MEVFIKVVFSPFRPVLATSEGIDRGAGLCEARAMRLLAAALLFLPMAPVPVSAQATPRIAVVDLTAVFEAHPRTAAATAELTRMRDAARKKFRAESAELKNTLQRHQELLRDGRRDEAAAELEKANTLERSIAELGTTNQRNIEEQFRRAKAEIMEDIRRVVREFNAQQGYALVFDNSSSSSNGLPQVLDAPGAEDITAEISARLKP
jgi:Skp family chaperone for outer membrane proteins